MEGGIEEVEEEEEEDDEMKKLLNGINEMANNLTLDVINPFSILHECCPLEHIFE
jgi:hypothetical protein